MGVELDDGKMVEQLAAKIHRGVGAPHWQDFSKNLRELRAPKKFHKAMRDHVSHCDRKAIAGRRPLNRPAKFPIAKEAFEVLQIDFFEFIGEEFLHMQDAFTRFSVLN